MWCSGNGLEIEFQEVGNLFWAFVVPFLRFSLMNVSLIFVLFAAMFFFTIASVYASTKNIMVEANGNICEYFFFSFSGNAYACYCCLLWR